MGTLWNIDNEGQFTQTIYNLASTQWSNTASSVALSNGNVANGMTFFTDANKVASGLTSWNEYSLAYGIDLTLTGTSGSALISIDSGAGAVNYTATFNTSLAQTVTDWIALHGATLAALGVNVLNNAGSPINGSGAETIRFCSTEAICNSVAISTVSGDLSGTRINPFTTVDAAAPDHVLVPYADQPYNGQRLQHNFRVNFGIATGNLQTLALSLRRFKDDSIIGSEIKVIRDPDVEGNQFNFISYTASGTDPFVTGGFYFALRNDSGVSVDINGSVGILIQTQFEKPLKY